jgi:transcriptional antiterminator RfaH
MEVDKQTRRCWFAAYTHSRHERRVASQIACKDVEVFLPTYTRAVQWTDRVKRSPAVLFPGYVFVHASDLERVLVLQTAGVVHIVSVAGKVAVLKDEEIEKLRCCAARPEDVEPHSFLRIGQRVHVKAGPFAGWEGILLEKQNSLRLVIAVEQIRKSVAINLHGADVEAVADTLSHGSAQFSAGLRARISRRSASGLKSKTVS